MWSQLHKLLTRIRGGIPNASAGSAAHAETGGVAIVGDNHAPIFTGAVTVVAPNGPDEEIAWTEGFTLCGRVVQQIAHARFDSATVVSITMLEDDGDTKGRVDTSETPVLTIEALSEWLAEGHQLLAWGEGGVGKTTVTLTVAKYFLEHPALQRLPLFLDAAAWAASSDGPLEHIAKQPAFAGSALTLANLARLMRSGRLVVLVDGWNELDAALMTTAQTRMREFLESATELGVLITSRNPKQHPLPGSVYHIRVAGITWPNQQVYIRSELPVVAADALIAMLAVRQDLRHAARNALVLQGIVALQGRGHDMVDRFRIYEAIVTRYEQVPARRVVLDSPPLEGHQAEFLRSVAWQMNDAGATTLSVTLARQHILAELERLEDAGLLDGGSSAGAVLRVLQDHHLLFDEGGRVRFAHQRFQEYFAAFGLVNEAFVFDRAGTAHIRALLNKDSWEDSIRLAAGTLLHPGGAARRGQLIAAAFSVDLQFCCELIRVTRFEESDNPVVYAEICGLLQALAKSSLAEVRDQAYGCMIDSGLPVFGPLVWMELEDGNPSRRLHVYRLGRRPVAEQQFGAELMARASTWPEAQLEEMIHELAGNPDNWPWLSSMAFTAASEAIRVAAISAIYWEYPASQAGLDAWMAAPDAVKRHSLLLDGVVEDLRERTAPEMMAELLRVFAALPECERTRLALQYPETLPEPSTQALIALVKDQGDRVTDEDPALRALNHRAPAALQALAVELVFASLHVPEWVNDALRTLSADERAALFDKAWAQGSNDARSLPRLARLADGMSPERLQQCLNEWLSLSTAFVQQGSRVIDHDRYFLLRDVLEAIAGDRLLEAALAAGRGDEELVQLLTLRTDPQRDSRSRIPWLPNRGQIDLLITTFGKHSREVRCMLIELAVRVDAASYMEALADCSREELDTWGEYEAAMTAWLARSGAGTRPLNPAHGLRLTRAWQSVGMLAVPSLQTMVRHPQAGRFVFNALATVLQIPWAERQPAARPWTPWPDLTAHHRRRVGGKVLAQPDANNQQTTDQAAAALVACVNADWLALQAPDLASIEQHRLELNINAGVRALARFPSAAGRPLLTDSWVVDQSSEDCFLDMVAALISQGWSVDDQAVVARLDRLWTWLTAQPWLDDLQKRWMNITGTALLLAPGYTFPPDKVATWRQKTHSWDAVNALIETRSAESFGLLCMCLQEAAGANQDFDALLRGLASAMNAAAVPQLIALIQTGVLFSPKSMWSLHPLAEAAAPLLAKRPDDLRAVLRACSDANDRVAVDFACSLLANLDESDELATEFATAALEGCPSLGSDAPLHFHQIFVRRQSRGESAHQLVPSASNALRSYFYALASSGGPYASGAKRLLCDIEENRRETYRPPTEPRHPNLEDEVPVWQSALLVAD